MGPRAFAIFISNTLYVSFDSCLVGFADNNSEPTWKAFVYLTGYLLVCVGESLNLNLIWYKGLGIAKRMRAALIHLVFQKVRVPLPWTLKNVHSQHALSTFVSGSQL